MKTFQVQPTFETTATPSIRAADARGANSVEYLRLGSLDYNAGLTNPNAPVPYERRLAECSRMIYGRPFRTATVARHGAAKVKEVVIERGMRILARKVRDEVRDQTVHFLCPKVVECDGSAMGDFMRDLIRFSVYANCWMDRK
jgi:hypothetical protein